MPRVQMVTVPRTKTCTVGPSATTGERCGQPAVTGFIADDGTHYYECADHAPRQEAAS